MRRPVRDHQHGTTTGYSYGCRCEACRDAWRSYQRGYTGPRVGAEALERVYAALEHEADMDGTVTATGERLGELAGISQRSANEAVRHLAETGRIKITGTVGKGSALMVDLIDGAA